MSLENLKLEQVIILKMKFMVSRLSLDVSILLPWSVVGWLLVHSKESVKTAPKKCRVYRKQTLISIPTLLVENRCCNSRGATFPPHASHSQPSSASEAAAHTWWKARLVGISQWPLFAFPSSRHIAQLGGQPGTENTWGGHSDDQE